MFKCKYDVGIFILTEISAKFKNRSVCDKILNGRADESDMCPSTST